MTFPVKWSDVFQRHCSDEALLAYADRELPRGKERRVNKHVAACWSCRARLSELNDQAQEFARAFSDQTFPGPASVASARDAVLGRARQFEHVFATASGIGPRRYIPKLALSLAGIVAAGALGLTLWLSQTDRVPAPREVLARTQAVEAKLYRGPVHQSFVVDIVEQPRMRQRETRLEVWCDDSGGRFASRWKEADGSLKHAVWRPDRGREYIFDPPPAQAADRAVSLFELESSPLEIEQLETGFIRWLERRRWRPISFVADLAQFASQEGILLDVRRIVTREGDELYQLSAQRRVGERTMEIVIDIDSATYRPRLQRVRIESAERQVELRLTSEHVEAFPPAGISAAIFEPDLPLKGSIRSSVAGGLSSDSVGDDAIIPSQRAPSVAEVLGSEIEVLYALHRAGACLGEPVEIAHEEGNALVVRGIVASGARRQEILTALAELQSPDWLRIDVQTVESALANATAGGPAPGASAAGSPADGYSLQFASGRLPIESQLKSYFADADGGDSRAVASRLAEFTRRAVSGSQASLDQAWALRRLADRYGSQHRTRLLPRSRWLLNWMINEHMEEFGRQSQLLRDLLLPVLSHVSADIPGTARGEESAKPGTARDTNAGEEWGAALERTFLSAEEIHRIVLGLLAGAGLPGEGTAAGEAGDTLGIEKEAVSGLLDRLPRLQTELAGARSEVAAEFASGRAIAGHRAGSQ